MIEYMSITQFRDHVISEINERDAERVAERLNELGWEKVVRCRDCKRWESGDCDWNPYYDDPADDEPDGFCKWAIRRNA